MRQTLGLLVIAVGSAFGADLDFLGLHHAAYLVSDLPAAERFYSGHLGYPVIDRYRDASGQIRSAWIKINDTQFLELFPRLRPNQDERFAHYAIAVAAVEPARQALHAKGLECSEITTGRDRNRKFTLKDPDGHTIEFVEMTPNGIHAQAKGKFTSGNEISPRLRHIGIKVRDEAKSLAFYVTQLGFRETWRGTSRDGAPTSWINLALPGASGDYIELMLYSDPPDRQRLGSMHHICLEVASIQEPWNKLKSRGIPDETRHQPRIGRNGRWLLNLFDPDGTRTELMEPGLANPR
jgi:catechol 2,3-dioxygenase-like lactoylglutathione lyase family enzyme